MGRPCRQARYRPFTSQTSSFADGRDPLVRRFDGLQPLFVDQRKESRNGVIERAADDGEDSEEEERR